VVGVYGTLPARSDIGLGSFEIDLVCHSALDTSLSMHFVYLSFELHSSQIRVTAYADEIAENHPRLLHSRRVVLAYTRGKPYRVLVRPHKK